MIVFLTLVYVALLAILVKVGVVKLNLFWKLSPLIWMLILFVVLFIPMQWGAPLGQVVTIQKVVEIVPNVPGEVVGVDATSMELKKQGDVLFRIDPVPFQEEVNRLEAALVDAEQNAKALPVAVESAKANVRASEIALTDAKKEVEKLRAAHQAATANVARANAELELAKTEVTRAQRLAEVGTSAIAQAELDAKRKAVDVSLANVTAAKAAEEQARLAHTAEFEGTNTALARAEQQLKIARATEKQAQLAVDSVIDGENTRVLQLRAQLAGAKFTLEQTVVRAPADGFVMAMTLRPGQRVAQMPLRAAMAFVETDQKRLIVGVHHYAIRHVKVGQKAEIVLNVFPGQVFTAKVAAIGTITPEGQMIPTGDVPPAPIGLPRTPYPVYLELDDQQVNLNDLPGGSIGSAAIFTENAQFSHVIRRVMLRMESWMNYVIP